MLVKVTNNLISQQNQYIFINDNLILKEKNFALPHENSPIKKVIAII